MKLRISGPHLLLFFLFITKENDHIVGMEKPCLNFVHFMETTEYWMKGRSKLKRKKELWAKVKKEESMCSGI